MKPYVWDEWPQFFRGRLRVLYELRGEVIYQPRTRRQCEVKAQAAPAPALSKYPPTMVVLPSAERDTEIP
jgi:hypothetical protein